jgi:glycosyltransferase involved in cell wall biosynthesis
MRVIDQFAEYLGSCYAPEPVQLIQLDRGAAYRAGYPDYAAAAIVVGQSDLEHVLARGGVRSSFLGWSPDGERVAVLERAHGRAPRRAPPSFRVTAIVPVFNEADLIEHTLRYLIRDGVDVYVIDNWSTDATLQIVRQFEGRGLLGFERFPAHGDDGLYDLRGILARVEQLTLELDADWFILHDADERRRTPWPDLGLRDALYHVQRSGFTCIDHVTLNFWPIDNAYHGSQDPESYFSHFEFSTHAGHFHQRRAWKNLGQGVSLAPSAGHDAGFYGRRVYPFKFLLKHYPIRSQAHGERKVLQERSARWNPAERSLGWHQQYDVANFIRAAGELERFDRDTFYERRLIERLSGVGVFAGPPAWATPPMWNERVAA